MGSKPSFRSWRYAGGEIIPLRGGISLADRGFRYGQHVFESIAVRRGMPLLVTEHLNLLSASAVRHGIPCSRKLSGTVRRFLATTKLSDGMTRVYLTAGEGSPGARVTHPTCYLSWEATCFPTPYDLENGMVLRVLTSPFSGGAWGEKSGNYMQHVRALETARSEGGDEGIVLDDEGRVLSCSMGNLIVWLPASKKGGAPSPCTPSTSCGSRAGAVLGWARSHLPIRECELRRSDLRRAVALAVTNSRLGVMPVASLDGRRLSTPSLALPLARDYLLRHGLLGSA